MAEETGPSPDVAINIPVPSPIYDQPTPDNGSSPPARPCRRSNTLFSWLSQRRERRPVSRSHTAAAASFKPHQSNTSDKKAAAATKCEESGVDRCAICWSEQKTDPVVLGCTHSYCCNCVVELLDHSSPDTFNCPQCRRPIDISSLTQPRSGQFRETRGETLSAEVQSRFRRRQREGRGGNLRRKDWWRLVGCTFVIATLTITQASLLPLREDLCAESSEPYRVMNVILLCSTCFGLMLTGCNEWHRFRSTIGKIFKLMAILAFILGFAMMLKTLGGCYLPPVGIVLCFVNACVALIMIYINFVLGTVPSPATVHAYTPSPANVVIAFTAAPEATARSITTTNQNS